MVVRIRFGRGAAISPRAGKNSRMARLAASVLTLVAISCGSLGMWRIGTDLDWAGDFVFSQGLFSHWQVWIAAAVAVQYLSWRLGRYAGEAVPPGPVSEEAEGSPAAGQPDTRATTNA
jgi:hypothetical protein